MLCHIIIILYEIADGRRKTMNYMTYYIISMHLLKVMRARLCLYYYIANIYIYTARTILYYIILAYFRRSASAPSHVIIILL